MTINSGAINFHTINSPANQSLELDYLMSFGVAAASIGALGTTMSETINSAATLAADLGMPVMEGLDIDASVSLGGTITLALAENMVVEDAARLAYYANLAESLVLNDTLLISKESILSFVESLIVQGEVSTFMRGIMTLSEALTTASTFETTYGVSIAETLGVAETSTLTPQRVLAVLESLLLVNTEEMGIRIEAFFPESIATADSLTSEGSFLMALQEGIAVGGTINLPEGKYTAWVVNAETAAPWEYDNYPFNSFASCNGQYLALTDSGLYELDGVNDAGTNIDAVIRTNLERFGTNQKKSIPWAYFGYTSSGRLLFKTITTDTGNKVENWYELEQRTAEDDTETRVNIGRGLRSVYWQFEITNIDGASFEFDDIQLVPARLKRRL